MLVFFSLVIIVIIYYSWKTNGKWIVQPEPVKTETVKSHWLSSWLKEYEIPHHLSDEHDEIVYQFDLRLKYCRAFFVVRENKVTGRFTANLTLPVIVKDEHFPLMAALIESFSGRVENTRLLLDKNEGTLHLRMEHHRNAFRAKSTDDKTLELCKLFHLADLVFPEFMHVLYGGGIPETAVSKLFGVRDFEMN